MGTGTAEPFEIHVDDDALDDLRARLGRTRWPDEVEGSGWAYGSNLAYMRELAAYWRDGYDWRAQERLLNSLPQFKATVEDFGLHFVHLEGKGPDPLPIIVPHGWPGSFFEMYKIAGPLTDPAAHGGDPADAFHLVAPSLPGYGFSERPREPGMNVERTAALFRGLMTDVLGYERFVAQGGDWGGLVCAALGRGHADRVPAIHVNMLSGTVNPDPEQMTEAEKAYVEEVTSWRRELRGYAEMQETRPQSLAYGLNDSPAGLMAWIVEKLWGWSDCGGDIERSYTKDELLTNVMIYWVTDTINSSMRYYYENRKAQAAGPLPRVPVPTGVAIFPANDMNPPREAAERNYNVARWTEMPSGGHFAAMEEPDLLVEDIRAFFRDFRT